MVARMTLSELESVTKIAQQAVQILAIVWGGVWAYLKFVRGRTFHPRAEVAVEAERVSVGETTALKVTVTITNAGASKLPVASCDVVTAILSGPVVHTWTDVANSRIPIVPPQIVESDESVRGQEIVEVPAPHPQGVAMAYRVRAEVLTARTRSREPQVRYTDAIVTVEEQRNGLDRFQEVPESGGVARSGQRTGGI
jgi:hypothetical protein